MPVVYWSGKKTRLWALCVEIPLTYTLIDTWHNTDTSLFSTSRVDQGINLYRRTVWRKALNIWNAHPPPLHTHTFFTMLNILWPVNNAFNMPKVRQTFWLSNWFTIVYSAVTKRLISIMMINLDLSFGFHSAEWFVIMLWILCPFSVVVNFYPSCKGVLKLFFNECTTK